MMSRKEIHVSAVLQLSSFQVRFSYFVFEQPAMETFQIYI